jgi:hypothetical protein
LFCFHLHCQGWSPRPMSLLGKCSPTELQLQPHLQDADSSKVSSSSSCRTDQEWNLPVRPRERVPAYDETVLVRASHSLFFFLLLCTRCLSELATLQRET